MLPSLCQPPLSAIGPAPSTGHCHTGDLGRNSRGGVPNIPKGCRFPWNRCAAASCSAAGNPGRPPYNAELPVPKGPPSTGKAAWGQRHRAAPGDTLLPHSTSHSSPPGAARFQALYDLKTTKKQTKRPKTRNKYNRSNGWVSPRTQRRGTAAAMLSQGMLPACPHPAGHLSPPVTPHPHGQECHRAVPAAAIRVTSPHGGAGAPAAACFAAGRLQGQLAAAGLEQRGLF